MVSRKAAKDQKENAEIANQLNIKNILATHHNKYSDLLSDVQKNTEKAKKELNYIAYRASNEIVELLYHYDRIRNQHPTLSEMYFSVTDMIHESFRPQLPWQTATNLAERFNKFRFHEPVNVPSNLEKLKRKAEKEKINFDNEYRRDPDRCLENMVLTSSKFLFYQYMMIERFDGSRQQSLFSEIFKMLSPYLSAIDKHRGILAGGSKKLEEGLSQNKNEEVPLGNSQNLWSKYKAEKCRLDLLQEFDLSNIRHLAQGYTAEPIPNLIYIGAVLKTISSSWAW
jgi:hypothetical protein